MQVPDFDESLYFQLLNERYNQWRFELDEIAQGVLDEFRDIEHGQID